MWLADETETVGLLVLAQGEPVGITVYDGESEWQLRCSRFDPLWRPLEDIPGGRLPLRYCTRLPYRRRPLKGVVGADGRWSEWRLKSE